MVFKVIRGQISSLFLISQEWHYYFPGERESLYFAQFSIYSTSEILANDVDSAGSPKVNYFSFLDMHDLVPPGSLMVKYCSLIRQVIWDFAIVSSVDMKNWTCISCIVFKIFSFLCWCQWLDVLPDANQLRIREEMLEFGNLSSGSWISTSVRNFCLGSQYLIPTFIPHFCLLASDYFYKLAARIL